VVLLDTAPIQSLAVVDALAKAKTPIVSGCRSYEQMAELHAHRAAIFVLAMCDVVVVVQDWGVDTELLRFLCASEELAPIAVAPPSTVSATSTKRATREAAELAAKAPAVSAQTTAEALFVFNRTAEGADGSSPALQAHTATIPAFLRHSRLLGPRSGAAGPTAETGAVATARVCHIPWLDAVEGNATVGDGGVEWQLAASRLRDAVFQSVRVQARTPQPGESERTWWTRARQVWTNIAASDAVAEYVAAMYSSGD